ncbi:MAG TPA: aspartate aminotransferase family protein, partial [Rhizobiales bacterium]|nr:aspartate aminotransferase family protein [Hyphomicrobiales bacterium]
ETYKQKNLFERVADLAPYWEEAVHSLNGTKHVIDLRNLGLVGAIELASRDGAPGARGMDVMVKAWEKGIMVRVTGDILALSPPFIIEKAEIDRIFETLAEILPTVD